MQKFIRLNTALIPPKEVLDAVISLSKKLSEKYKAGFVLDEISFHPHITLYSPEYPKKNLNKVFETVEKIAKQTPKMIFVVKSLSKGDESIIVDFVLTPEIRRLHKEAVEKLNPLREGRIPQKYQDKTKLDSLTLEQRESMLKYGSRRCMNLYNPHITITTIENDKNDIQKTLSKTEWKIKEFEAEKIGVYTMGEHGTCTRLLKSFTLK